MGKDLRGKELGLAYIKGKTKGIQPDIPINMESVWSFMISNYP